jgi:hypothetical protein
MRRNSSESKQRRLRQTLLGAVAIPRLWIGVFLVGCLLTRWSGSWGSAFSAFGPEDFLRSTGAPVQEVRTFTVSNPGLFYTLRLYNGGQQGQYCPVSSAIITLNGLEIWGPNNFNPNVILLEASVTLASTNTVVVELRGKPGCGISLTIIGDNTAPVANAGPDQSAHVGVTVTLDGSGSSDADGDPLTYQWSLVSKPNGSSATLTNPSSVNPTFVLDRAGDYVVRLIVHDGREASAPDTVTISSINSKPLANAGPDQTGVVGTTITLDGTASSDVDGDTLVYQWRFVTKPGTSTAALVDSTGVRPTFTLDAAGTYIVELIVNDGIVNGDPDTVTISTVNSPPVADAGTDQSYPLGATVMLDGSGSTDVDGDRLTYLWALTAIPANSAAELSDRAAIRPTFVIDVPGTYTAQLLVNDGTVYSSPATVTISTLNSKPLAHAGPDQSGTVGTLITLDGTASSDPDGDPLSFTWSLLTKPLGSAATVQGGTTAQPTFTLDRAGTYVLQLIVNDGHLDSVPDLVTVTTLNSRPVADAGPDQDGLIGTPVQLNGSGSHDVDGSPLTYFWSFLAVPAGSTISLSNDTVVTPTFTPDVGGTYVAQLIVSDGQLKSEPDTVVVSVPDPTLSDDDGDGFTEREGDCDDTNATIFPGTTDISSNGIDEDCDGMDRQTLQIALQSSAPSVAVGATFTVTIAVPGLEGVTPPQIVSAFDLDVLYNSAILQLTSVTFGTQVGPSLQATNTATPGVIDVAELSRQTDAALQILQPDTVTLVTLTFRALAPGTSVVSLAPDPNFGRDVKGLNAQPLPLPPTIASTSITVMP